MTRQETNIEILDNLYDVIVANPNWRFGQVLQNTLVVVLSANTDTWTKEFYTEPKDILDRMVVKFE